MFHWCTRLYLKQQKEFFLEFGDGSVTNLHIYRTEYLYVFAFVYSMFKQFKVPMKWKIKLLKISLLKRSFKAKKDGFFLLVIPFFLPEIFKFLLICKLGTDDVTRCVCKGQNTKPSISLERMKQCNGNFAWTFNPI